MPRISRSIKCRISIALASVCLLVWASLCSVSAAEPVAEPARHWSYRPLVRPDISHLADQQRVRTPLDVLVLQRLQQQGLTFAPEARPEDLLRRVTFDLHGLPPTPAERAGFLADARPDAYERLVDRLLQSPRYGEQWGRIWLDVVRFAETAGYNADPYRPLAYKYRDYVIQSFNEDVPFDRFVQEQIAGDELYPERQAALIATGFMRLPPDESNASNIHLARQDQLNDLTGSIGSIFLGQTVACAQCHDHKFDDISQKDFYRLQAFFAGIVPVEAVPAGTAEELAQHERALIEWERDAGPVRAELHQLELAAKIKASDDKRLKFPTDVLAALDAHPTQRTALQQQFAFFAERQVVVTDKELDKQLTPELQQRRKVLLAELRDLERRQPKPPQQVQASVVREGPATPPTYLLATGSYDKPLEEVLPGFLSVLAGETAATISPTYFTTLGRRTALARWLTDPVANPLPARVIVNRVWQGHFGRGLVENANDFGVQTPAPVMPEVIDWLATELIREGWSLKQLHRTIVLSSVYRQSTQSTAEQLALGEQHDPGNQLWWHFDRRRLTAENLRDAMLAVSGQLDLTMYGPGVKPELPPGVRAGDWPVKPRLVDLHRRSLYIYAKRNLPYPFLQAFDLPDTFESCACRQVTTTGPQALMLLNSEMVLRYSQAFAARVLTENPSASPQELVQQAFLLCMNRAATADEQELGARFLREQAVVVRERIAGQDAVLLPEPFPKFLDPALGSALIDLCHALFNSNEFLHVE